MKRQRAMTVLELLVATSILVVVATLAYGAFTGLHTAQRDLETRQRMISGCRNALVAAQHRLAGLAPAQRVLPREGESRLDFTGASDHMVFRVASLAPRVYLAARQLQPPAAPARVVFAYHRRGSPLDQWEPTWENREQLPDLVRVTATADDPAGRAGAVELTTLVPVRCAP